MGAQQLRTTARTKLFALASLTAVLGVAAQSASASFPGSNGKILFAVTSPSGDSGLYTMDPDGQNRALLAREMTGDFDTAAEYSADGERIAFARFATDVELFGMDADGQNLAPITDNTAHDFQPSFFPDGRIAFLQEAGGDAEIFVLSTDAQSAVQLTFNDSNERDPTVSPDGTKIAFTRGVGGDDEIFVMDANGANETPLTANDTDDQGPSFSPDGRQITFHRGTASGEREIVVMSSDGQGTSPLTSNTVDDLRPVFSPDGTKIAFQRLEGGDSEIFRMDADGQNQVALTENSVGDHSPNWQPLNAPAFDLSAKRKQKSVKKVDVTVASANEDATVTIAGTVKAPKGGASASKAKRFDLVGQAVELQPGQPISVELVIPKRARKALKQGLKEGKKAKVSLTASATDDLGASTQDAQKVKLKKEKK